MCDSCRWACSGFRGSRHLSATVSAVLVFNFGGNEPKKGPLGSHPRPPWEEHPRPLQGGPSNSGKLNVVLRILQGASSPHPIIFDGHAITGKGERVDGQPRSKTRVPRTGTQNQSPFSSQGRRGHCGTTFPMMFRLG